MFNESSILIECTRTRTCPFPVMKLSPSANATLRQWGFEIFCVFTASCVLVVMSIVLFVFDSKPVFDGRVVTLNAIVSTLSTASRVSLLAMLASAISQWNWIFFTSESRRLVDFEYLAAASRGPLGSVVVLLNTHITGGYGSNLRTAKVTSLNVI